MKIRQARPDDAPRLTELARAAKAVWGYPSEWLREWSQELTLTSEYLSRHRSFVCEEQDRVVGMLVLEDRGGYWWMEHVWVDPALQKRGVGRALVEHGLATARGVEAKSIRLLSDPFAEGFYLKLGARRVAVVRGAMPGQPDRVLPLLEFSRSQ